MTDVFSEYYQTNFWAGDESMSGQGSDLNSTFALRAQLSPLFTQLRITSVLDIPCGDYHWFQHIKEIEKLRYIGADVVPELIFDNSQKYPGVDFRLLDITRDKLPKVDLIFVRDLLGHFSNADVSAAIKNIKRSNISFLLATTFPGRENHGDIKTGEWRPVDLSRLFGLPEAERLISEDCKAGGGQFADKSMGLWSLAEYH